MLSHFLRAASKPIEYIGISANEVTSATTIDLSPPSGTLPGDLLVVLLMVAGNPFTYTGPAGWTEQSDSSNRAIYTKTATAGEGSSTFTASSSTTIQGYMVCFRWAAFDVIGSGATGAGTTTVTIPEITLAKNGSATIAWFNTGQASATFTTPTNYTSRDSNSNATAPSTAVFTRLNQSSGATGDVSSTSNVTAKSGYLIGLKPIN